MDKKSVSASLIDPVSATVVERVVQGLTPSPRAIWLFGSRARGDAHADSDYDFLLVFDTMPESTTRIAQKAYRLLRGIRVPVDIVCQSDSYFQTRKDYPHTLPHEASRHGILLYAS